MVGATGVSWGLTLWAPFALIAECVSHINDVSRRESLASSRRSSAVQTPLRQTPDLRPADSPYAGAGGISVSNPDERQPSTSLTGAPVVQETSPLLPSPGMEGKGRRDEVTSAGAIMGLHNVFISSPQFISTLLASIIFHFLGAGGRGDDIPALRVGVGVERWTGGGSIAWVLRVGGLGAIYAAYLTWKLAEEIEI
jgi:solute carrier family 45, member 1/2/4